MTRFSTAIFGALLAVTQASAQETQLIGDWSGEYVCSQGLTRMTLRIERAGPEVSGLFAFYAHEDNPGVPSGCFELSGTYDAQTGAISLAPGAWLERPDNYRPVGLEGVVDLAAGEMTGLIPLAPCGNFDLDYVGVDAIVDDICHTPLQLSQLTR